MKEKNEEDSGRSSDAIVQMAYQKKYADIND